MQVILVVLNHKTIFVYFLHIFDFVWIITLHIIVWSSAVNKFELFTIEHQDSDYLVKADLLFNHM